MMESNFDNGIILEKPEKVRCISLKVEYPHLTIGNVYEAWAYSATKRTAHVIDDIGEDIALFHGEWEIAE